MNFTEIVLKQRKVLFFILIAIVVGGIISFTKLGKLEDAEIPVKSALVVTYYPGASPHEVELQVTDVLETAVQSMDDIDNIESRSLAGYSEIIVNIKQHVKTNELPQIWDVLRRKVYDISGQLPSNAQAPIVFDDFGDVSYDDEISTKSSKELAKSAKTGDIVTTEKKSEDECCVHVPTSTTTC